MFETIFISLIIILIYHFGLYFCVRIINIINKSELTKFELIKYTLRLSVISTIFIISYFLLTFKLNTDASFDYLFYLVCKPLILFFFIEKYIKINWKISFLFIVFFLKLFDILFINIAHLLLKTISF